MNYDGISMLRGGLLQIFSTNYNQGYYGSGSRPPQTSVTQLSDGGRLYSSVFQYQDAGRSLNALQKIEVHPDNQVIISLSANWKSSSKAVMEWNPLRFSPYLLLGASYSAQIPDGSAISGIVSYLPLKGGRSKTDFSPPFTSFTFFHTPIGSISVTDSETPFIIFDGRDDPYLQDDSIFWGGPSKSVLTPGKPYSSKIILSVIPKDSIQPPPLSLSDQPLKMNQIPVFLKVAQAALPPLTDQYNHPVIVPSPKEAVFSPIPFNLSRKLSIWNLAPPGREGGSIKEAVRELGFNLKRCGDTIIQLEKGQWNGKGLLIAVASHKLPKGAPIPPDKRNGYSLLVNSKAIYVVGYDSAGAFYGLQTLRQLLRSSGGGSPSYFIGTSITDWPSLSFRGAHLFVGKDALPFHERLIDRVFSRLKLNKMVIECEYTAWKSHPELVMPNSMPENDLRKEVAFCRTHFMEPIPLVESLGHCGWMFVNNQHHELAEDITKPNSYDVSDPASYRLLFDIYRETLNLFHPKYFHIGHDEVAIPGFTGFGTYPDRPENVKIGLTKLFINDTDKIDRWLTVRHVRPMMWADMTLNPQDGTPSAEYPVMSAANAPSLEAAREIRAGIPKNMVMCDWHYGKGEERRNGINTLQKAGFQTIGAAWHSPENIRGWALQAIQKHALGTLQTTWAGYDSNESILDQDFKQFSAFVLAAEYAWSGTNLHPLTRNRQMGSEVLPYAAASMFARLYGALLPAGHTRSGWRINLAAQANIRLRLHHRGEPWIAASPTDPAPVITHISDPASGIVAALNGRAIMLRSYLNRTAPSALLFSVHSKAAQLAFLQALAYGNSEPGTEVAEAIVRYSDGKNIEIPFYNGKEIASLDQTKTSDCYHASTILLSSSQGALGIRLFRWTNPHPDLSILSIEYRALDLESSPILFGITGVAR